MHSRLVASLIIGSLAAALIIGAAAAAETARPSPAVNQQPTLDPPLSLEPPAAPESSASYNTSTPAPGPAASGDPAKPTNWLNGFLDNNEDEMCHLPIGASSCDNNHRVGN